MKQYWIIGHKRVGSDFERAANYPFAIVWDKKLADYILDYCRNDPDNKSEYNFEIETIEQPIMGASTVNII